MSAALRVGGCEVLGLGALTPRSSWGLQPRGVPGGLQEQEGALAEPSWPWPSWHNVVAGRGERGGVCLEQAQEQCAGCRGRLHVQGEDGI